MFAVNVTTLFQSSFGTSSSAMAMITVAPRKRKLFELLNDKKVRRIVLLGESGIGKTWTAREIRNLARKRGLIDIALWVFLNREYDDRDTLCDSIAHQLSLLSTTGELEVEDENEELKEENQGYLKEQISAAIAGKKLLLVLDDEGNKMTEQQIMSELETLLNLKQQNYKVLITTRDCLSSDISEDGERSVLEVKPLSREESMFLLQQRDRTRVYGVPGIKALAEDFVEKTKNLPAAIVLMAKAFSYFPLQESGVQMLKCSLEEASDEEIYSITQLLRTGYDLLPNSILIDCCWGGSRFFHDRRRVHYNELIAYWVMEGYLGHIDCMQKAYEKGHQVLMNLIDCQILKSVEADYIIMEGWTLNLDDILMERGMVNLDACYRCGFGGTASLGLANVFGDGKWEGLGRITHKDGVIKTLRSGKQGKKCSTLLLDGNSLSTDFPSNFFQSHKELKFLPFSTPPSKHCLLPHL